MLSPLLTFFPHFDTMAHIKMLKIIFKSIRQLGSFTLYSSVTNSTHQPIKKLSVFSDTDAGNKLKFWQKLTWKIFRLTKKKVEEL